MKLLSDNPKQEALASPPPDTDSIPVLPLRSGVLFPKAVLPFSFGRTNIVPLLSELGEGHKVIIIGQRDASVELPQPADLYETGTLATIHKIARVAGNTLLVFCEGIARVKLTAFVQTDPWLKGRFQILPDQQPPPSPEFSTLVEMVSRSLSRFLMAGAQLSDELPATPPDLSDPGWLADFAAAAMSGLSAAERQMILDQLDIQLRLQDVLRFLLRENERLLLQQKLQSEVESQFAPSQREAYLHEQLKAIHKELGDVDDNQRVAEELKQKIEAAHMPAEAKSSALREWGRLQRISPISSEYAVARNYLEWMVSLPWSISSAPESPIDLGQAAAILDEDHYGLQKVKDRILDFLAVMRLRPQARGPILCFVGPPGVGKTSLGRSIAKAVGRRFARLSLGGLHDEAEIRGHRRTYVGALPGQIIQCLKRVGTNDPVLMLDELEKLGRDYRGDPASALLEVLDPEQNSTFRDNYLDVPFDLSRVLFITTANQLDPIPGPLLDRLECIEISGYTETEKLCIARRYLVPGQIRENGLLPDTGIQFTDEGLLFLIRHYTREAGVRNAERAIGELCRKQARRLLSGQPHLEVTPATVEALLGPPRFRLETEISRRLLKPGVAVGLAWTPAGGDILFIEAGHMTGGSRSLTITGQLGTIMQESVQAALTWVRTNAASYGIEPRIFQSTDIHVHVPSGAIPKDGPSAGITIAAAILSTLTGRRFRNGLAMTGEITLSGSILPVGGIREKVLAARRNGILSVILPAANEPDVQEDFKSEPLHDMEIHYAQSMQDVVHLALDVPRLVSETD